MPSQTGTPRPESHGNGIAMNESYEIGHSETKKKKYGEERTLLIPFSGPREFSSQAAEVLGPKLEATSHRSR